MVVHALTFLTPHHHAIVVPSPGISRTAPPCARTNAAMQLALMAAPRQLFPAVAGSNPSNDAVLRLKDNSCADHNASTIPHAKRPRKLMVGLWLPLNWNSNAPPGRNTRNISRTYENASSSLGKC